MCGILGLVSKYPVKEEVFLSALNKLSHRGPDDEGQKSFSYDGEFVYLGHKRLSIIDLTISARQPISNENNSIWLIYNGEIYNYCELRTELIAKGHTFSSRSDSEVLLHLYEEDGIGMLNRLNGIFAFGIWDDNKKELFIARDAMGVKPLYYSETASSFLFSSELKAMLVFPEVSREIDIEALYYYLTYLWSPAPKTMLRNIKKLSPGYALIVKNRRIARRWQWYKLPYNGNQFNKTEEEISQELAKSIKEAVKRQLVSDVPVGAFLSGGLDSSAVVCMMRNALPDNEINCYNISFENISDFEGSPLDLPYAEKVARHLGVNLHKIVINPDELINKLEEFIYYLDVFI